VISGAPYHFVKHQKQHIMKSSNYSRREFLKLAGMGTAAMTLPVNLLFSGTKNSKGALPNIVYILSDDIGYGDVGAYHRLLNGSDPIIPTPHLDRLSRNGMMFMDAHTPASLSAPTRYASLTGNYPFRGRQQWGVWLSYQQSNIRSHQQTVAHLMKDAGYRTAFFGKWHIGGDWYDKKGQVVNRSWGDPEPDIARGYAQDGPTDQGFDYSCVLPAGIQHSPYAFFEDDQWMKLQDDSKIIHWEEGRFGYSKINKAGKGDSNWDSSRTGPQLADKAVHFIDDHQRRHPRKPFMMYYCSQAVHVPHTPPEQFNDKEIRDITLSHHGDMIYELDQQVGAIVAKLKKEGILNNTLIIFTSDNGGLNVRATEQTGHDSSGGLHGSKGQIYEGGHRVPFIAQWGDGTPAGSVIQPGSHSDQTICIQDWVATMYDLTGQPMQKDQALDSISLLPLLAGNHQGKDPLREVSVYQASGGNKKDMAIRMGDWKLMLNGQEQASELYNLAEDLKETRNLIDDPGQQSRIREMMGAFQQIRHNNGRSTPLVDYSRNRSRIGI